MSIVETEQMIRKDFVFVCGRCGSHKCTETSDGSGCRFNSCALCDWIDVNSIERVTDPGQVAVFDAKRHSHFKF